MSGRGGSEAIAAAGVGISLEIDDDGVALLEFDDPGATHNRFTPELLDRMQLLLSRVQEGIDSGDVRGVVLTSAKPDSFVAGMDVSTIAGVSSLDEAVEGARTGQRVFSTLAALPVTTVAAINGTCLGGATEMVLACDRRLAADASAVEIGLPEIRLGIIPGFGGTQRLPRLVSLERAVEMIASGRSVDARRARRYGLVDELLPASRLLHEARRVATASAARGRKRVAPEDRSLSRRLRRWMLEGNPVGRAMLFRAARARTIAATRGLYEAPLIAIDTIRRGRRLSLERGLALESRRVGELAVSETAKNLMGIFFLRQAARRVRRGVGGVKPLPVRRMGVIGAGVMGGGIASLAASRRIPVRIKDIRRSALTLALRTAHRSFEGHRRRGRLADHDVRRRMDAISPTLEYNGFRHADLIVEAVIEDAEIKREVLARAEAAAGETTVLATNTSSLTVESLGRDLADPGRLVGMHFFNPVERMPLVEIVRGPRSRDEAVVRTAAFAARLGKVPVVVADLPGFFVNRVLGPYMGEALQLLAEGNEILAIDGALRSFGMPMGPLRLFDEVGIDVALEVTRQLAPVLGERVPRSDALARLRDLGRLGRKSGGGFYHPDISQGPDLEIERMLRGAGGAVDADTMVDRCMLAMLNEAARALEAGVVASPLQADLAVVFGTGFAPLRGGIFRYAQRRGLPRVLDRMRTLAADFGERFQPAPALTTLADGTGPYPADWPRPGSGEADDTGR